MTETRLHFEVAEALGCPELARQLTIAELAEVERTAKVAQAYSNPLYDQLVKGKESK